VFKICCSSGSRLFQAASPAYKKVHLFHFSCKALLKKYETAYVLPASYSPHSLFILIMLPTPRRFPILAAISHPSKTAYITCVRDECSQSVYQWVCLGAVPSYFGDRLAAAKSWIGFRMEICPRLVTLEALTGNGYAPARGMLLMMMMICGVGGGSIDVSADQDVQVEPRSDGFQCLCTHHLFTCLSSSAQSRRLSAGTTAAVVRVSTREYCIPYIHVEGRLKRGSTCTRVYIWYFMHQQDVLYTCAFLLIF